GPCVFGAGGGGRMDIDAKLTGQEKEFLSRAARRRRLFLFSSVATVVVAVTILVYHGLIVRDMDGPRFVILLLLLLSGRSYLRLYKSATIFSKLKADLAAER
ncbi:MAG TPA: hypothetical protein VN648_12345, partial [Candidatus Methylomirabilis sp.]|nr:hypothetical protein [Candidatus Methylomirabilis sp.]